MGCKTPEVAAFSAAPQSRCFRSGRRWRRESEPLQGLPEFDGGAGAAFGPQQIYAVAHAGE